MTTQDLDNYMFYIWNYFFFKINESPKWKLSPLFSGNSGKVADPGPEEGCKNSVLLILDSVLSCDLHMK